MILNKPGDQYKVFDSVNEYNRFLDSPHSQAQELAEKEISKLQHAYEQSVTLTDTQIGDKMETQITGFCSVCLKATPFDVDLK